MGRDLNLHDHELTALNFVDGAVLMNTSHPRGSKLVKFEGVSGGRFVFGTAQRSICSMIVGSSSGVNLKELGLTLRDESYKLNSTQHLLVDFEFNTPDEVMLVCESFRILDTNDD